MAFIGIILLMLLCCSCTLTQPGGAYQDHNKNSASQQHSQPQLNNGDDDCSIPLNTNQNEENEENIQGAIPVETETPEILPGELMNQVFPQQQENGNLNQQNCNLFGISHFFQNEPLIGSGTVLEDFSDTPSCSYSTATNITHKSTKKRKAKRNEGKKAKIPKYLLAPDPVKNCNVQEYETRNFGVELQCDFVPVENTPNFQFRFPYLHNHFDRPVRHFGHMRNLGDIIRSGILMRIAMYNEQDEIDIHCNQIGRITGMAVFTYQIARFILPSVINELNIRDGFQVCDITFEMLTPFVNDLHLPLFFIKIIRNAIFQIRSVALNTSRQITACFFSNSPDTVRSTWHLYCNGVCTKAGYTRSLELFDTMMDVSTGENSIFRYFLVIFLRFLLRMADPNEYIH